MFFNLVKEREFFMEQLICKYGYKPDRGNIRKSNYQNFVDRKLLISNKHKINFVKKKTDRKGNDLKLLDRIFNKISFDDILIIYLILMLSMERIKKSEDRYIILILAYIFFDFD